MSKETRPEIDLEIIQKAQKDDEIAINQVLEHYKYIITILIKKSGYFISGGDEEDLLQIGLDAIVEAVKKFDSSKNAKFSTFASLCIDNRLKDQVRKNNSQKNQVNITPMEIQDTLEQNEDFLTNNSTIAAMESEERKKEFYDLLASVCTPEQVSVIKYKNFGLKNEEIAQKMNITYKQVDNLYTTAKSKIKKNEEKFRQWMR